MLPSLPFLTRRCLGLAILGLTLTLSSARAYVLEGYHWPSNQPIVIDLQLGSPSGPLIDGSTTWNQVAEAALNVWNPYLGGGIQFQAVETVVTPAQRDGINSVFFSDTIYGEAWGDDTLAITLSLYNPKTNVKLEADVLFNSNKAFNSYRGPLHTAPSLVDDLRRTAIHEFGHVLGLEHTPQTAQSIMTPDVTNIDTVQADDIAGVQAIYGPVTSLPAITSALTATTQTGQPFTYQITTLGTPTGFAASGLPLGLSLNGTTGAISGVPTVDGTYQIALSATNANGTATATLTLTVASLPVITSSLTVTAVLNQPFSYQITATGHPTSFVGNSFGGLSLDPATGVLSGTPNEAGDFWLALTATNAAGSTAATLHLQVVFDTQITVLHSFFLQADGADPSNLILASDGNFYGTTSTGGLYSYGTVFQLTPTGDVTTLHHFNGGDGARPRGLIQASDGNFYGVTDEGGLDNAGTVFRCSPTGDVTTLYTFPYYGDSQPDQPLVQGADGNLYGTTSTQARTQTGGSIFKITLDGTLTTLYRFDAYGSTGPSALVLGPDGSLYGTLPTPLEGNMVAQIFRLAPDGTFSTVCALSAASAASLPTSLLLADDGNLYGAIQRSVGLDRGLIFKCTLGGTLTVLHTFGDAWTNEPSALVQGRDGNFYGTTQSGQSADDMPAGTVFQMTPDGTVTTLHAFTYPQGAAPTSLLQGADGSFYGAAGVSTGGILFNTHPAGTFNVGPLPTVTLATTTPEVTVGSGDSAVFTVTLSAAQTTDTLVHYTIKGSGINGTDYVTLTGTKKIKAGKTSKPLKVTPLGDLGGSSKKTVKITLAADPAYTVGTTDPVKVKILAAQ